MMLPGDSIARALVNARRHVGTLLTSRERRMHLATEPTKVLGQRRSHDQLHRSRPREPGIRSSDSVQDRTALAQQGLAEFYSEMVCYPTRTKLDDVHRTITELCRELRAFKHQNRESRRAPQRAASTIR